MSIVKDTCTKWARQGNGRKTQTGGKPQSRKTSQENHHWKVSKHGQYVDSARDQKEGSRKEVNLMPVPLTRVVKCNFQVNDNNTLVGATYFAG